MRKVYSVSLTNEQRDELKKLTSSGRESVKKVIRARILLKADIGESDREIAAGLDVGVAAQLVRDAREHGSEIYPVDVNQSIIFIRSLHCRCSQ